MHRQLGLFNHDLKSYESINIKRTTSGEQLSNEYIEKRNTLIGVPWPGQHRLDIMVVTEKMFWIILIEQWVGRKEGWGNLLQEKWLIFMSVWCGSRQVDTPVQDHNDAELWHSLLYGVYKLAQFSKIHKKSEIRDTPKPLDFLNYPSTDYLSPKYG